MNWKPKGYIMAREIKTIRPYESVIILKTDTPEEKQKSLIQRNKQIIESYKGALNHVDTWGKRRLANPIKKEKTGIYFHTTFTANTQVIAELERTMRINDDVLRFVHVRLDDGTDLNKHVQEFKDSLSAAQAREKEREKNFEKARAQRQMKPSV
jgi:small subunit ribosomal protein S6